ncbi:MAG: MBL fold metallo-hydrolase, partial [Thermomicrobium sp.]|nr:MBL fold metallo-hydrolase [Thermomicrobium sp.]
MWVRDVGAGWFVIDLQFQGVPEVIAAYVYPGRKGTTIIDTGPSTTIAHLMAGLAQLGVHDDAVRNLVLTHIHLDHGGAAGALLTRFANARVFV